MAGKKVMTDEEAFGVGYDNQITNPPPAPPAAPVDRPAQTTLFRPLPPGQLGPPAPLPPPKGKIRFDQLLALAPQGFAAGSKEWDEWLVKLRAKSDPNDPEYTQLLERAIQGAHARITKRYEEEQERKQREEARRLAAEQKQQERSKRLETDRETRRANLVIQHAKVLRIVGPDGKPMPVTPTEEKPDTQTAAMAPSEGTEEEIGAAVRSGEYVWFDSGPERSGNTAKDVEVFMTVDDAEKRLAGFSPQDIAAIQDAFDLPITGLPDKGTQAKWDEAVATAARLTAAGRNVSVEQILGLMLNAEEAKKAGRGGGGGGGGGGGYNPSQVKAFFVQIMKQEVGREPTEQEANAFVAAFSGAGDVDPTQFATDWIRGNLGKEAGAYSAVNYYDVIMQLLAGG